MFFSPDLHTVCIIISKNIFNIVYIFIFFKCSAAIYIHTFNFNNYFSSETAVDRIIWLYRDKKPNADGFVMEITDPGSARLGV